MEMLEEVWSMVTKVVLDLENELYAKKFKDS